MCVFPASKIYFSVNPASKLIIRRIFPTENRIRTDLADNHSPRVISRIFDLGGIWNFRGGITVTRAREGKMSRLGPRDRGGGGDSMCIFSHVPPNVPPAGGFAKIWLGGVKKFRGFMNPRRGGQGGLESQRLKKLYNRLTRKKTCQKTCLTMSVLN